MRRTARTLGIATVIAGTGLTIASGDARAAAPQQLVLPPPPNVLILMDTSGSMTRTSAGYIPNCSPGQDSTALAMPAGDTLDTVNMDRWGQIIQGLTGTVTPFYSCSNEKRDGTLARFATEYSINGKAPPDLPYLLPYNRPLSGDSLAGAQPQNVCAVSPNILPGAPANAGVGPASAGADPLANAYDWKPKYIKDRQWPEITGMSGVGFGPASPVGATCQFQQATDGQIDAGYGFVRFALMTTDSDPGKAGPPAGSGYGVFNGTQPWTSPNVEVTAPFTGQWTYLNTAQFGSGNRPPQGNFPACSLVDFAVGAKNWSAPPWEGRMVGFPQVGDPDDINNDEIQRVILATRPYGASPIDGLLFDGYDYLWASQYGPGAGIGSYGDPAVQAFGGGNSACRKQYVILVSDGGSNLDMRNGVPPASSCANGGQCPFPKGIDTAQALWLGDASSIGGAGGHASVETFVIGFSAKGDQTVTDPAWFTTGPKTCSAWYQSPTGGNNSANTFHTLCGGLPPASLPPGSTPAACCYLNDLAFYGSGGATAPATAQGAFFVDTGPEFGAAFGAIMGTIAGATTSRATPAYSTTYISNASATNSLSSYFASLTPTSGGLWSSNVSRSRSVCAGAAVNTFQDAANTSPSGDNFAVNMNSKNGTRYFLSAGVALDVGSRYDATLTTRPYYAVPTDIPGTSQVSATEVKLDSTQLADTAAAFDPDMFGFKQNHCPAVQTVINEPSPNPPVSLNLPRINGPTGDRDCMDVAWGFATGYTSSMTFGMGADYNVRCSPTAGRAPCSVLGGILHSQPQVVAPPSSLITDEAYRAYAAQFAGRPTMMYVETLDGLLHGFDAANDLAGSGPLVNELFAFVPPIVLPTLYSNYPAGDRQLMDSTPTVKDVVWDRLKTEVGSTFAKRWHTMLIGSAPNGFFGLEVTDPAIGVVSPGKVPATYAPSYTAPPGGTPSAVFEGAARVRGPHFLWQLSTVDDLATNNGTGSTKGRVKKGTNNQVMQLFADNPGRAAITTLYFDPAGGPSPREIGVAILPGGVDNTGAVKNGTCPRGTGVALGPPNGIGNYAAIKAIDAFDTGGTQYKPRLNVRQWNSAGCDQSVSGRAVYIVRLDNGQIIKAFGRKAQDFPSNLAATAIADTPLDSPMTGTPMPWPAEVGSVATSFYIGDADGTLWRFDLSSTDPSQWHGNIYFDTQNQIVNGHPTAALEGQPISVDPVLTTDPFGHLVVSIATGDQDSIQEFTTPTYPSNYVVSLSEKPVSAAPYLNAQVNWYYALPGNGERVTGPMLVFGGVHYFASYAPATGANYACTNGTAYLFGLDYINPQGGLVSAGGAWRAPSAAQNFNFGNNFIPGVSLQSALSCAATAGSADYFGSRTSLSYGAGAWGSAATPSFALQVMTQNGTPVGGVGGAGVPAVPPPQPAFIDSWAAVIE